MIDLKPQFDAQAFTQVSAILLSSSLYLNPFFFPFSSFQLDEMREIIVQLEAEQESLTRRLVQKDHQIQGLEKSLTTAQQQLATKQVKLDKVSSID